MQINVCCSHPDCESISRLHPSELRMDTARNSSIVTYTFECPVCIRSCTYYAEPLVQVTLHGAGVRMYCWHYDTDGAIAGPITESDIKDFAIGLDQISTIDELARL